MEQRFGQLLSVFLIALFALQTRAASPRIIRSAASGPWSAAATWAGGKLPAAGDRVLIREGHQVVYDVKSDAAIRAINIAGVLSFASDRDTQLNVGLIKIQPGENFSEDGFD